MNMDDHEISEPSNIFSSIRNFSSQVKKYFRLCYRILGPTPSHNLYSKYRYQSLAILSDCKSIEEASEKAASYNIPLLEIVITNEEEEEIVKTQLFLCFEVARCLNQSFLLYGEIKKPREPITQGYLIFKAGKYEYDRCLIENLKTCGDIVQLLNNYRDKYYSLLNKLKPDPSEKRQDQLIESSDESVADDSSEEAYDEDLQN